MGHKICTYKVANDRMKGKKNPFTRKSNAGQLFMVGQHAKIQSVIPEGYT